MELEEGECLDDSSGEDEPSGEELAEDGNSKEDDGAVLTELQQQLQMDLNRPCDEGPRHIRARATVVKEEEDEEDRVPMEKLEALGGSEAVCGMLANPHLRKLLIELDTSPAPQQALRRAMNIPVFMEFADECLRVCGLRDSDD